MGKDPYTYFRVEARELLEGLAAGVLSLEKDGLGKEVVSRLLRQAHTLKGAARVVKQVGISESAHGIEDVLTRHRDGQGQLPHEDTESLLNLIDRCGELLKTLAPAATAQAPTTRATSPQEEAIESVRVEIAEIDTTLCDIAEAQIHLEGLSQHIPLLEQLRRTARRLSDRAAGQHNGRVAGDPAAKAAAVASLAEELRTTIETVSGAIRTGTERMGRRLVSIRERTSEFRLLPASTILGSLERSARDVAESLHKRAALEMTGGDQRLDAHVLLALRDALIHAVRNAVAHGIESESQRSSAGKPPCGRVWVQVRRSGQRVVFCVEDDGRGLDIAAIRSAAIARGVAPASGNAMDATELTRLLFRGGLSTSAAVSEFSGRGVGLDAVRATAARLKGDASLHSEAGRGTTVEISVPVSIESLAVLAVVVHKMTVLIPFAAICQVVRAGEGDMMRSATGAALIVGDQAIPYQPLGTLFGARGPAGWNAQSARRSVVIIEAGGARAALGVDRLKDVRHVVVRPLPSLCGSVPFVAGATLNGLGNPELVLDAAGLVEMVQRGSDAPTKFDPPPQPTVLVVDDSLTTRMLEQNILEAAGFRVDLATSGEEALEKAREKPHSLFVVDVEMPGMNGFELLHRFRGDPQLHTTPAIMVTSRATPDDRRSAREAGARGYIVKSEFDESRLLRIVRELLAEVAP